MEPVNKVDGASPEKEKDEVPPLDEVNGKAEDTTTSGAHNYHLY